MLRRACTLWILVLSLLAGCARSKPLPEAPTEDVPTKAATLTPKAPKPGVTEAAEELPTLSAAPIASGLYSLETALTDAQMAGAGLVDLLGGREPLVAVDDLIAYRLAEHELELTPVAFERIKNLQAPVDGLPFVVVVDGAPVYQGAFWPLYSSLSYNGIAIWLPPENEGFIQVVLGYPGPDFFNGEDSRSHPLLLAALRQAGKLDE